MPQAPEQGLRLAAHWAAQWEGVMNRKRTGSQPQTKVDRQRRALHAQRMQQILDSVSQATSIDVQALRSHNMSTIYVDARLAAIRLARRECISFPQMGHTLGGRSHATIMGALRRADYLVSVDPVRGMRILSIEAEAHRILSKMEAAAPPKAKVLQVLPPVPTQEPSPQLQNGTIDRWGQIICKP